MNHQCVNQCQPLALSQEQKSDEEKDNVVEYAAILFPKIISDGEMLEANNQGLRAERLIFLDAHLKLV